MVGCWWRVVGASGGWWWVVGDGWPWRVLCMVCGCVGCALWVLSLHLDSDFAKPRADLDGNGFEDIIAANTASSGLRVYFSNGGSPATFTVQLLDSRPYVTLQAVDVSASWYCAQAYSVALPGSVVCSATAWLSPGARVLAHSRAHLCPGCRSTLMGTLTWCSLPRMGQGTFGTWFATLAR